MRSWNKNEMASNVWLPTSASAPPPAASGRTRQPSRAGPPAATIECPLARSTLPIVPAATESRSERKWLSER